MKKTWRIYYWIFLYPLYDFIGLRWPRNKFVAHFNRIWDDMSAEDRKYIYLKGKQ